MGRVFSCMLSSDAGVGITEDGASGCVTMTTRHAPNYFWSNKLNKRGPVKRRRKGMRKEFPFVFVCLGVLGFASVNSISSVPICYCIFY
jgi:hypothetical protein